MGCSKMSRSYPKTLSTIDQNGVLSEGQPKRSESAEKLGEAKSHSERLEMVFPKNGIQGNSYKGFGTSSSQSLSDPEILSEVEWVRARGSTNSPCLEPCRAKSRHSG